MGYIWNNISINSKNIKIVVIKYRYKIKNEPDKISNS